MIETHAASISARLAATLLEWLDGAGQLPPETDLCLIYRVRGLDEAELPAEIVISGERRWRLAAVDGDFALRVALVDASTVPLVAFTPFSEEHFQADLRERTALRRVIRPLARHVLAALIARDASALDDDRFSGPLAALLDAGRRDRLLDAARRRSWGPTIREADAVALICAAAFDFDDRYVERAAGELWQRWIVDPPLVNAALLGLADETLRRRYPLYLKVLDAPPHDARAEFLRAARHDSTTDPAIRQLGVDTARRLLVEQRQLLDTLLGPVEAAYVAAGSPAIDSWMLAGAYAAQVRRLVQRCSTDEPPTTTAIGALEGFVYERRAERAALVRLARLSRGLRALETRALPVKLEAYAAAWRDDFAWLDRAARRLRESHVEDAEAARAVAGVLGRWYALRDRWNAAFAQQLAIEWPALFKTPGRDAPLVVSHVLKHVVRPELPHKRTFLIVLDGCDMPTFLEIVDAFSGVGVKPERVALALSAIPTVTSHARRAIFGGTIPHDGVRDDDRAADAYDDRKAFEGPNEFLGNIARRLFLKGDLGDAGEALVHTLQHPESAPQLVAAVFNDVDDAIGSKEHGVLAERSLDRCTPAFRATLLAASDAGWRIIITADHGHTPYREPDVKTSLAHARFAELGEHDAAPSETIVFEKGIGMPYRIAALYRLGEHSGPQHIGYHGGVSLEEMFVPLAIYGPSEERGPVLATPVWWDDVAPGERTYRAALPEREYRVPVAEPGYRVPVAEPDYRVPVAEPDYRVPVAEPIAVSRPVPAFPVSGAVETVRDRCRTVLASDAKLLSIFNRIAQAGTLDAGQLARATGLSAGRVRPSMIGLRDKLEDAGIDPPFTIDDEPLVVRWVGTR